MRQEHVLSVLYDLALTITGKTDTQSLVNDFLARLVYHTGFANGIMLYCEPTGPTYRLAGSYGNPLLSDRIGEFIDWPRALLTGPATLLELTEQEATAMNIGSSPSHVLRLPVEQLGVILLFCRTQPNSSVPLEHVFTPVLASFARAHQAYHANEVLLTQLQQEIEERRNVEIALRAAKEEAETASRAKSDFLSNMSHELRTPMNAIMGFAQLLELELQGPQQEYVSEISKAAEHLLSLINELLDLAKIEAGAVALDIEPTQVSQLLDACFSLLKPVAAQNSIHVYKDITCNVAVMADRLRLKQILLNLISNAIKYNHPGGSVHISCRTAESGRIRICVKDDGPGIALDKQQQLFSAFNRLGKEMSSIQGTGIGLVISQQLIRLMQGNIGFESQPGLGTIFWIEIAAACDTTTLPAEAPQAAAVERATLPAAPERHTVLYIEDHPANVTLMQRTLKPRSDLHLLDAPSGSLGLAIARSIQPDLILLDIHLPDMDGFAILQHLRADPRTAGIPVIAVTADTMQKNQERARKAGFDGYLTKPIRLGVLLQQIDLLLSRQHDQAGQPVLS